MTNITTPVVVVAANAAVVAKIESANASAKTADTLAREAATLADTTDYLDMVDLGNRLDSILALYMPTLIHKTVKESFSAALAILVADKPVRIEASSVTTSTVNGQEKVSFKAPEILTPVADKNEIATPDKSITTMEPGDAVMKLAADTMKAAATAARNTIGRGRAQGGGRKVTKPNERAAFADELVAHLADKALGFAVVTIIETAAKNDPELRDRIFTMAINLGAKLTIKK